MKRKKEVDLKNFKFKKINNDEYKHLKYLIFWPIFGILFFILERVWIRDYYYPVSSMLDDYIPFCEYFLIPYLFWFLYLVLIHIYTGIYDVKSFEVMMRFIIISYFISLFIYIIFPNCQELRPINVERDNIFTRFLEYFYKFDTNTNVCPSIHVIGSVAVMFSAWYSKDFHTTGWRILFFIMTFIISVSTLFIKQHSIIDVFAAIPVCIITYFFTYRKSDITERFD